MTIAANFERRRRSVGYRPRRLSLRRSRNGAARRRPALVIAAPAASDAFAILWVLMITSAAHERWPLDVAISNLRLGGLTHACVVRVSKVTTLDERLAARIGELSAPDRVKVAAGLRTLLGACSAQAHSRGIAGGRRSSPLNRTSGASGRKPLMSNSIWEIELLPTRRSSGGGVRRLGSGLGLALTGLSWDGRRRSGHCFG